MNHNMSSPKPPQRNGTGMGARTGVSVAVLSVVLAIASFLVYLPALRNGFVDLDDPAYVTQNDHVRTGLTWNNIQWAFTSTDAANWHPVTWVSHMLDCQIFGLSPAGHHAVNIALHALNAALLFLML